MKISVGSRSGRSGSDPQRLCLGRCSLPVIAILDRYDEGEARVFEVRVLDGRRFVVRRQADPEAWELVAAYGRAETRRQSLRPAGLLLVLILAVLCRKALDAIKRARAPKRAATASTLPSGGAAA